MNKIRTTVFLTTLLLVFTLSLQIRIDTPNTKSMSFISSLLSHFHSAPKAPPAPNYTGPINNSKPYLTSGGVPSNSANNGSGLGTSANYLNPYSTAVPQYLSPIADSSGNYTGYSTGGYGSTGGGYGTAQPDTTALQNSVRGKISAIQNAYASLQGAISPVIQDKVNQYLQSFDTQQKGLNDAYGTSIGQTQNMFGARGLGDSSFQGNALDEATNTYKTNLDALNQDKQTKLAGIGQYAKGIQSQAQSAADQYNQYLNNLGQYSASDLSSLDASLGGALPGIQSQVAGMGTNQSFLDALNQYAPAANQGASQLQAKLAQLAKAQTPLFAKNQIAQGLIKSSQLTDPNAQAYYNDYFQKLLSGQGA